MPIADINVIIMQSVFTLCIAFIIKLLVNIGLTSIVHTLEFLSVIISIVLFVQGSTHWFITLTLMIVFWRYTFRLYSDCSDIVIANKEKLNTRSTDGSKY